MKKYRIVMTMLLTLSLIAGFSFAGATAAADGPSATPGDYTATAPGRNGDVTVTVTFSDSAIEDIHVVEEETQTIGSAAILTMCAQAVADQTLQPDAVSGATISGSALLTALADIAQQAGAEGFGTESAAASPAVSYDVTEADVIVVGAGGAGMTAAYTLLDQGVSVILLEKSGVVGGNSLCSQMGINAAGAKVQEELGMEYAQPELLKEAQMSYGGREDLVDAYVAASGETVDFLHEKLGVEFESGRNPGGHGPDIDPENPLASVLTDHPSGSDLFMVKAQADGYTSLTLVNALSSALEKAGVVLYKNTEATALLTDESGRVCGVKAIASDGSEVEFAGKAVLLATGGFGQNHEMLVEVRPDFANAITDEMAPTTGDGIRMASELGAKTVDLAEIQTFPHVPYGDTWLPPMAIPGGFRTTAIFVNQDAQRYTTEGFETAEDTLQQESAYCIFSEEDLNDNLRQLMGRGIVKTGESAAELAEALGLDADALQATVEQWNADCAAGADSLFGNQSLKPLEGGLCGYRFGVGAHYMMGGLLINENTQVLNENEEIIPGLYAAGETTGGFHGTVRIDGSGTGDAFTFGYLAGEKIAAEVQG